MWFVMPLPVLTKRELARFMKTDFENCSLPWVIASPMLKYVVYNMSTSHVSCVCCVSTWHDNVHVANISVLDDLLCMYIPLSCHVWVWVCGIEAQCKSLYTLWTNTISCFPRLCVLGGSDASWCPSWFGWQLWLWCIHAHPQAWYKGRVTWSQQCYHYRLV